MIGSHECSDNPPVCPLEKAIKAINEVGITSVAVLGTNSAVVATEKNSLLLELYPHTNLHKITAEIGCVTTGVFSDSIVLVDNARTESFRYRVNNRSLMPIRDLCKSIAEICKEHEDRNSVDGPLKCSMILISYDMARGPLIYKTDPAAMYYGCKVACAGVKSAEATAYLEEELKKKSLYSRDDTIQLAISSLLHISSDVVTSADIEVGVVSCDNPLFTVLKPSEIEVRLTAAAERYSSHPCK